MTIRTTGTTVTFSRPFVLAGFDEQQPAGTYRIEADEELLEGLSFPAYRRRVQTLIHLHPKTGRPGLAQTLSIDPGALDAALQRDRAPADIRSGRESSQKTPSGPAASRWAEADRQATERGEDEGMIAGPTQTMDR